MKLYEVANMDKNIEFDAFEKIRIENNWSWVRATKNVKFKGNARMIKGEVYLCDNSKVSGVIFKKPEIICTCVFIPGFGVCSTQINTVEVI